MALDKTALGLAIADALASAHGQGKTSIDTALGNAIADGIDTYTKGGSVAFASGTINGVCPTGGGPLTLGLGTGGTIS